MITRSKLELPTGVEVKQELNDSFLEILSKEALSFVVDLHRKYNDTRLALLQNRVERQKAFDAGVAPSFLSETEVIRNDNSWKANDVPSDLQDRRVEITGPVERKMMINALNSGANVFMADFEDSNSPTWENCINGQINLRDAVNGTISFKNPDGKEYKLNEKVATLVVRPRGWHLTEKNVLVDGAEISAGIFDFGLYFYHNVQNLLKKGTAPYFYLPKMESHKEARLWNEIFNTAQELLNIPKGTIKVTVLIETFPAAFETEEIIYELKDHMAGLNAGRWDYIFSTIKKFRNNPDFLLPDRSQVTMTVPFMKAYSENLVKTCHKRNVHAMGGMSAFIPNRKDVQVTEAALKKVREDKEREVQAGFDGTWVAHPDLVSVAKEIFDKHLGDKPNQKDVLRPDVNVDAQALSNFNIPEGKITEAGVRSNITVAILYIGAWLTGTGAVAIFNLMEDAATAEISRAQLWQWIKHRVQTKDGTVLTPDVYKSIKNEELNILLTTTTNNRLMKASKLLDDLVLSESFCEFLTIPAYEMLS